ncbi:MAG: biotin/lipoyl-binding protein [Lachnospiraceae bacterium]|nr:biotin/lipoyl-binding protein [Lachnospiraceae bacterium]
MHKGKVIKIIIIAIVLSAFIGGSIYAMTKPASYEVVRVKRGNISGTVEESGEIRGDEEIVYFSDLTVPVEKVNIKEGDRVSSGELLISFDHKDLERALEEAGISRAQAEENYNGSIMQSDKYASKYNKAVNEDNAYASLYWLYREQNDSITEEQYNRNYQVQCQIDSLNKEIAEKKRQIAEKTGEYDDTIDYGLTDPSEYSDGDKEEIKDLKEDIDELNTQIADLSKGLAISSQGNMTPAENKELNDTNNVMEDITRNWNQAKSDKAQYEGGILNEEQKKALARNEELLASKMESVSEDLAKAKEGVCAKESGVVTTCNVKDGSYVNKGDKLLILESDENLKCTVMISKYDIGLVREGQRAEVDVAGKLYEGEVARIDRLAKTDESDKNKVSVDIALTQTDDDLIIGIEADVTVYTEEEKNALLIPSTCLYSDDEGDYVYIIRDSRIAKQYVESGLDDKEYVQIISGLNEGDSVICDAVTESKVGEKAVGSIR